ncbi:uncharacterized protein LACBIDRAFT_323181 [Laccaria bicolor S238N-H82]|uniref:Predicted protein n=1 Tax=Laccaria bicolor (strain S238N-H82 / ATCC MYA-4686) TaxID=486041 RepID=B0CZD6_LACBS|nr:uncharacterized protein LACBIDRAFT_323181 [Laccaria bicolor S238N-H82]EDR12603.1 predicted protein [Laccaria bicolor S238N-H82]|eukprot:XP_001876867.1 predicted protein [Laccaria bicolor S238N-H82]
MKHGPINISASYDNDRTVHTILPVEAICLLTALGASLSYASPSPPTIVGHLPNTEITVALFVFRAPSDVKALKPKGDDKKTRDEGTRLWLKLGKCCFVGSLHTFQAMIQLGHPATNSCNPIIRHCSGAEVRRYDANLYGTRILPMHLSRSYLVVGVLTLSASWSFHSSYHANNHSIPLTFCSFTCEGILNAYDNNFIYARISIGQINVTLPELLTERSPAHAAYCAMVLVIAAVISSGTPEPLFRLRGLRFQFYGDQISRALPGTIKLSGRIQNTITLLLLEEIEQVVNLFYNIAASVPAAGNVNPAMDKGGCCASTSQDWHISEALIVPVQSVLVIVKFIIVGEPASLGTLLKLGNGTVDILCDLVNQPAGQSISSTPSLPACTITVSTVIKYFIAQQYFMQYVIPHGAYFIKYFIAKLMWSAKRMDHGSFFGSFQEFIVV